MIDFIKGISLVGSLFKVADIEFFTSVDIMKAN